MKALKPVKIVDKRIHRINMVRLREARVLIERLSFIYADGDMQWQQVLEVKEGFKDIEKQIDGYLKVMN